MKNRFPKSPVLRFIWLVAFCTFWGAGALFFVYSLQMAFAEGKILKACKYCDGYDYLATDPKRFYVDVVAYLFMLIVIVTILVRGVSSYLRKVRSTPVS